MRRILLVFGTRPEAIKMAPVYRALKARGDRFDTLCCVTGQHRAMLDQVLEVFGIRPDFDLDVMRDRQCLTALHAAVSTGAARIIAETLPDLVLVHGDTATAMASALAAFHAGVPVGHVEAGLRSGDLAVPFPEEFNRRFVGTIARFHFAPTEGARAHLLREGCDPASIAVTGNTVVDALRMIGPGHDCSRDDALRQVMGADPNATPYVLVTCHRREAIGAGLGEICAALNTLVERFPEVRIVFPLHPNPALRAIALPMLDERANLRIVDPLPFDIFVPAMRRARFLLTDSGGMQEEGAALGTPVLVMRDVTERPEALEAGGARLIGTSRCAIVEESTRMLTDDALHRRMADAPNPFGDGHAATRIADFLEAQAWLPALCKLNRDGVGAGRFG